MKRFKAGPLFHRIIHNFNLTLHGSNGEENKGRLIYLLSGHDKTITSILNTLNLYANNTLPPRYASALILELHRIQNSSNELEIKVKS